MGQSEDSTQDKINMKDHDLLTSIAGKVDNLVINVQSLTTQLQSNQLASYNEFKSMAIAHTKLEGEIQVIKTANASTNQDVSELSKRVDGLDAKWKIGDIVTGIAAVIAGVMAWFR